MTSPSSTFPSELCTSEPDVKIKNESRSASPVSFYGGSPERVTRQNQLLQPVLLLNIPSRSTSEINLVDSEKKNSNDSLSKSENAYTRDREVSQEETHLKESNSKRMGWVKLIRIQLSALHEKKAKATAGENRQQESNSSDSRPIKEEIWPNLLKEPSHPSEALQRMSVPWIFANENRAQALSDLDLKTLNTTGNSKKNYLLVQAHVFLLFYFLYVNAVHKDKGEMVNAVEFMATVQLCAASVQNLLPLDSIVASLCKLSGRPPTSLFALFAGLIYCLAAALYHRNGVEFLVEGADSLGVSYFFHRTTNVKGKISSFWRQAAAAALRHQKQSEDTTNQKSYSSSPTSSGMDTEEAALRRTLTNLFQISWPTYQQVSCWQHSFQNLLQDEHGILIFREFLQGEFSDENLEFWIACQKYKYLTDVFIRKQRAQEIYDGFIAFQSQREVNLDCETRIQTEMRLSQAEPDLFDASQKRIEALMEKDPYRRFLRSNLFLKLLDKCQKLKNTSPHSLEDDFNDPNSNILTYQASESTAADGDSLKSQLVKTKPSQSIDLGDLKVVSEKLTKS
ncbi:unnamed protein product [Rodentolepis nana]|uniref:RGS domain-containing protein n=1 Tax=Rodentolepis nana TaxID=102285 RepID=A0A158QI42_RODNA|nr:unnamed protein product [Rodentolepis nana]